MEIADIEILENLGYNKQLVFAYLACERLYPNFAHFSDNFDFGDKAGLRSAIDYIFDNILESDYPKNEVIVPFISIADRNMPYPHDFDTGLASSALDSSSVVFATLNFMCDRKYQRIRDVSTLAPDTVDMFIGERDSLDFNSNSDFESKIANDPFMKREISIQKGIITYLSKSGNLELADINTLMNLQNNNQKSNIDL